MEPGHDHSHEPQRDPAIEQLAYNELAASYGRLYGELTRAHTTEQVLTRTVDALKKRLNRYTDALTERGLLDEGGNLIVEEPAEPEESDE